MIQRGAITDEMWTIHFFKHKPLNFKSIEDVEKYLNGEEVDGCGSMEYDMVPSEITHTEHYEIRW